MTSEKWTGREWGRLMLWSLVLVLLSRIILFAIYETYVWTQRQNTGFWDSLNTWDAGWYLNIIQNGYGTSPMPDGTATWAFFPLLPAIVRFFWQVLGGDLNTVAGIVMSGLSVLMLAIVYRYLLVTGRSRGEALGIQIFFSLGLYSFYFALLYTETLYLLLLVATLYFLRTRKYLWMGVAGALLSATRNTGIMVVFAIAVQVLEDYCRQEKTGKSVKDFLKSVFSDWKLVLGTCLIPLGMFSYIVYLGIKLGDPLAFLHVQVAWGTGSGNPFKTIWDGLQSGNLIFFCLACCAIVGLILLLYLVKEKRWSEVCLAVIFWVIPLSVRLYSIPRYLIGGGVFVFAAGDFLAKRRSRVLCAGVLVLSILINLWLVWKWFSGSNWLI